MEDDTNSILHSNFALQNPNIRPVLQSALAILNSKGRAYYEEFFWLVQGKKVKELSFTENLIVENRLHLSIPNFHAWASSNRNTPYVFVSACMKSDELKSMLKKLEDKEDRDVQRLYAAIEKEFPDIKHAEILPSFDPYKKIVDDMEAMKQELEDLKKEKEKKKETKQKRKEMSNSTSESKKRRTHTTDTLLPKLQTKMCANCGSDTKLVAPMTLKNEEELCVPMCSQTCLETFTSENIY